MIITPTMTTTRGAEGLDRRAFTVSDVERMLEAGILDQDDKFELIGGEIVPMNSQLAPHAQVKARIARALSPFVPADCLIGNDITVRLGDKALFEPDVLVWRPIKGRAFIPLEASLFAAEVADTSMRRDLSKAPEYGLAGLPELWIVDLGARETLVWRRGETGFAAPVHVPFEAPLTPLFAPAATLRMADFE